MGWHFTRLFGCDYDSDSFRVQGLWTMAQKKKQTRPIGRETVPRSKSLLDAKMYAV